MGEAAAAYAADRLRARLAPGGLPRVAFAAAASPVPLWRLRALVRWTEGRGPTSGGCAVRRPRGSEPRQQPAVDAVVAGDLPGHDQAHREREHYRVGGRRAGQQVGHVHDDPEEGRDPNEDSSQEGEAHRELERATREGDLERAAQLRHGEIPDLERRLQEAQAAADEEAGADAGFFKEHVDAEDIAEVVARWTGIPVSRIEESETAKLVHMEERLHQRVIGQDEAVEAVAGALRRSRAGLQDPDRPIGSFLFLGPTGVGKTELARALAEFMFDSQDAMIRIDMSEYMEKHSVSRLVGAPPGYVGYEEGGQLTEAVRRRPYSVVLLDELEKAHSDVFNTLLQVLDDGRLTDGQGRTVDFKNTVLIMTSNVGSGTGDHMAAVQAHFKPEFINRLDDIVEFRSLTREQIAAIVDLQVARLIERVRLRGIAVELTDEARTLIGDLGYDPTYGARPLKRVIQKRLVDPLAIGILEGRFGEGDLIRVDAADGELTLSAVTGAAGADREPAGSAVA